MNISIRLLLALVAMISSSKNTCIIRGSVVDKLTDEPLIFATVVLYSNGKMISGTETDIDGKYYISGLPEGMYDIEASYTGYATQKISDIITREGHTNTVDCKLAENGSLLESIEIREYKIPLIEMGNTTQGAVVTAGKIRALPTKQVNAIETTTTGLSPKGGDEISVRGSRSAETVYFIDGVRSDDGLTVDKKEKPVETLEISRAGLITAGEWNDLHNWGKWSELLQRGEFKNMNQYWGINTRNRYPVFVTNERNEPVYGVRLYLKNSSDSVLWSTVSDVHGRAELFDTSDSPSKNLVLLYQYGHAENKIKPGKSQGTHILIKTECNTVTKANIAFVVDATGSMSDEIEFLKSDLGSVIESVEARNSHVKISYSSVFYRDIGDSYVTIGQNFTDDRDQLTSFIRKQHSSGGGDFPEAVDSALTCSLDLMWEEDAAVKLIFLVLDAPPHLTNMERYKKAVTKAAAMGIKIIPVTASGIDRQTEFLMKFTSVLTNGTYVFITDDSGIGGSHLAPVHNEYEVEKLDQLMVRIINGLLHVPPCGTISNEAVDDIILYPNPATSQVRIKAQKPGFKKVEIIGSTGHVLSGTYYNEDKNVSIDVRNLVSGQYFARILYDDAVVTRPFIKL